ncbi:MAG: response regulator transcription factor [Pseudomonadota bacterium]
MRILLVEDNEQLGSGLKKLFDRTYAIDHILNGESALLAVQTVAYDLVVLDLSLPDIDGLEVLREMRNRRLSMPVLILTARDKLGDRISGLDRGADDYMTKPFELSELEARIRALLRRASIEKTSLLKMGDVEFDLRNNSVTARGATLDVSARETMVLRALMLAHGRLLSKVQLLDTMTHFDDDVSENAIEQYVSRLRKKLSPFGLAINTARGLGYHLREVE